MIHSQRMGAAAGLPAVLAHCFLGQSGGWSRLVAAMRTPLAAVAIDLPGHGLSDPPRGDLHAEATAEMARIAAGTGAPVLLVGHSLGATVALRVALEAPQVAAGLVLIEPVLFAAARRMPEFADYIADQTPVSDALARGDTDTALHLFLSYNAQGADVLPDRLRRAMGAQMPLMNQTGPVLAEDTAGLLVPGGLERLTCPVLLIVGALSRPIFPAVARALAARLPDAETVMIAEAAHMAPITHPQAVAGRIDDWLERRLMRRGR